MFKPLIALSPIALLLSACAQPAQTVVSTPDPVATPDSGAVTSADPRATAAGEAILAKGGSATDAAIAVMLALTVVEPQSSGIGGGGFMVRSGEDGVTTLDGRETAPSAATGTRFLDEDGEPLPRELRVTSGLSVGVPGNLALAAKAHEKYGVLAWADLFEPAIALARDGFVVNRRLHASLSGRQERAGKTKAAREIFFGPDGEALPVGALVKVPELADTMERIAAGGIGVFYQDSADKFASYVAGETPQDGVITAGDVTAYQAKELTTEQDDRNECEVVKLDVSAWKNDPEGNRPLLKAEVKNWTEMKEQQARRDAKNAAETAGASSGGGGSDWMPF